MSCCFPVSRACRAHPGRSEASSGRSEASSGRGWPSGEQGACASCGACRPFWSRSAFRTCRTRGPCQPGWPGSFCPAFHAGYRPAVRLPFALRCAAKIAADGPLTEQRSPGFPQHPAKDRHRRETPQSPGRSVSRLEDPSIAGKAANRRESRQSPGKPPTARKARQSSGSPANRRKNPSTTGKTRAASIMPCPKGICPGQRRGLSVDVSTISANFRLCASSSPFLLMMMRYRPPWAFPSSSGKT